MMTLGDIHRNAKKRPGVCAVCGRKLRAVGAGRPGILCSVRLKKACKRAYQAAYQAANYTPRLWAIIDVKPHPSVPRLRRVKLECGHTRELPTGEVSGRQRSHCPRCSPIAARKKAA